MTVPAPKPIEDCPNPECKHFCAMYEAPFVSNDGLMHKVKCDDCGYMGPWARTSDEAIRLHNLLCRPQQSAEPVRVGELFISDRTIDLCPISATRGLREVLGDGIHPIYAASPGPSELVEHPNPETQVAAEYHAPMVLIESPDYAEYLRTHPSQVPSQETQAAKLRELEKEFRETAETLAGTASAAGVLACADRLSAIVKEYSK